MNANLLFKRCFNLLFISVRETLFVTVPIDNYEPYGQDDVKTFEPDPNLMIKKRFHGEPKNHSEIRDASQSLSGLELQKVFAGPMKIDYGNVYVNSEMTKTFSVRNDLRNSISVVLISDRVELKKSNFSRQIIPSGATAGFDIIICSRNLGNLRTNVKYIINGVHEFEF